MAEFDELRSLLTAPAAPAESTAIPPAPVAVPSTGDFGELRDLLGAPETPPGYLPVPKGKPDRDGFMNKALGAVQQFAEETVKAPKRMAIGSGREIESFIDIAKKTSVGTAARALSHEYRNALGIPMSAEEEQSLARDMAIYKKELGSTKELDRFLYTTFHGRYSKEEFQATARGAVNLASIPLTFAGSPTALAGTAVFKAIPNVLLRRIAAIEAHSIASFVSWNVATAAASGEDKLKAATEGAALGAIAPGAGKLVGAVTRPVVKYGLKGVGAVTLKPTGFVLGRAMQRVKLYEGVRTLLDVAETTWDHIGRSGESLLRSSGAGGLADELVVARSTWHIRAGTWYARTHLAFLGLKKKERILLGEMLHATPEEAAELSKAARDPGGLFIRAQDVRGVLKEVAEQAEAAHVTQIDSRTGDLRFFLPRKDFGMPHVFANTEELVKPGPKQEEAIKGLMAERKMSRERALKILNGIHARNTAALQTGDFKGLGYINLQGRRYNIPGFITDPGAILPDYFSHMARRIEYHTMFGNPSVTTIPGEVIEGRFVQRFEEPGIERATVDKPHGVYTSPAELLSPHKDLGGEQFLWKLNPEAKVLELTDSPALPMRKGAIDSGAGVHAAFKLLPEYITEEFTPKLSKEEAIKIANKLYPKVNFNEYYDAQEVIEALGALQAKNSGYEIIRRMDKLSPEFSEIVLLTKNAAKDVTKLPSSLPTSTILPPSGKGVRAQFPLAFARVDQIADPSKREIAQRIVERQLGAVDKGGQFIQGLGKVAQYQAVMKLGLSQITQLTQFSAAHIQTGFRDGFSDLLKLGARDPETHLVLLKSGAFMDSFVREAEQAITGGTSGASGRTLKRIGFTAMDTQARVYGAFRGVSMAHHQAEKLIPLLERRAVATGLEKKYIDHMLPKIEKKFMELGIDPAKIVQQGGQLAEDDMVKAAQKISTDVNFWSDSLSLPEYLRSPWGRVLGQFKTFAFQQSRFIKNAVVKPAIEDGDLTPFLRMMGTMEVSGEVVADLKSMLRGKPREKQEAARFIENLAMGGSFGIVADAINATNYSNGVWNLIAGPTVSDAVDYTMGLSDLTLHGRGGRKLGKKIIATGVPLLGAIPGPMGAALGLAPTFTPALVNALYPPKGQQ